MAAGAGGADGCGGPAFFGRLAGGGGGMRATIEKIAFGSAV